MTEERCFPVSDSLDPTNPGDEYYQKHIMEISKKCWEYYESNRYSQGGRSIQMETLYTGSLGPCCYLRYRIATSSSFTGDLNAKFQLFRDCLAAADGVLKRQKGSTRNWDNSLFDNKEEVLEGKQPVTLLNGERVGALSMKIVTIHNLLPMMKNTEIIDKGSLEMGELLSAIQSSINELLEFATKYILSEALSSFECEVFAGRAGYLKAIKFVKTELGDMNFGKQVVVEILEQVLEEGLDNGNDKMLLWKYKQKCQLGSLHGVAGILHTLLDFDDEIESISGDSWKMIENTILKLDDSCLKSGNLAPSLKSCLPSAAPKRVDKLIQFCSGSPGHVLLLTQMYRKSVQREQDPVHESSLLKPSEEYLDHAAELAKDVVFPRGLLQKGVGLCHGTSGNAFVFLSMYREMLKTNEEDAKEWLEMAYGYANFALDMLDELEDVPKHPKSLYEGLGGLVCLLLGLVEGGAGTNCKFPCYEF